MMSKRDVKKCIINIDVLYEISKNKGLWGAFLRLII